MKALVLLLLGAYGCPAWADGPALAQLRLSEQTITLTADPTVPPFDMIQHDGDVLRLRFAQLHLGFPTPPLLTLTLHQAQEGWVVHALTLEQTSAQEPLAFSPRALTVTQVSGTGPGMSLVIEGEAMVQSGGLVPVHIDIALRSP